MQRKTLVVRNIRFLTNVITIYSVFISLFFSVLFPGLISNTVYAGSYNGPDFYVSVSGNNSNNGSFAYPWLTLEYAMSMVSPGDIVYVRAGKYVHDFITTTKCGTAGNWITYKNYGDGEVILDATGSASTWAGAVWFTNVKYVRFSGFTIRNSSSFGILIEVSTTCNNITIDNCTIHNCSSSGIAFEGASGTKKIKDLLVENNIIYDCQNAWYLNTRTQEGITFSECQRFICRNNYMYTQGTNVGIDIKNQGSLGYLYNNRINTTGTKTNIFGIYVDAGNTFCNNISIYNNIIWGAGSGYALTGEAGGTVDNITLYNNIFNGTGPAFRFTPDNNGHVAYPKKNIKLINNIVASGSYGFRAWSTNATCYNLTVRNNIFNCTKGLDTNALGLLLQYHHIDHNLYHVTSSDYYGSNSINGSPCFVDPTNNNFRLLLNSPAIDTGSSDNAPLVDFDGIGRPQGSAVDIGAFEFTSEYDTTLPQISAMSIATSTPLDTNSLYGWVNISCTATDNVAVSQVILKIHNPGGSWNNVSMTTRTSGKYYYQTSTAFSNAGNYTYTIYAKDTNNNTNTSSNILFSMPPNWDINNDGICSILDLVLVSNQYSSTGNPGWIREDVDNNGIINVLDINLISNHYEENWYP